eukprot:784012-Pleurochrysis_carterae.AAC.1
MQRTGLQWHELPRGRDDLRILEAAYYEEGNMTASSAAAAQAQTFLEHIFAERLELMETMEEERWAE